MSERLVCVTGASGYIGSHVTRELLERGWRVRATVRDANDANKTQHLLDIAKAAGAADRLELHSADLMKPGDFDAPIAGCEWVCHVASAVFLNAKDPQREIIDVAVQGTGNVLSAIGKAGTVKRVGLTSSIAAVHPTARPPADRIITEDDWNDDATVASNPYGVSKVRSERAVWKFRDEQPKDERFDLVVVNPVFVLGPVYARVHVRSSTSIIRDIMRGSFHGCPALGVAMVDVRDVTTALVNGLDKGVTGRYILANESMWMRDIAKIIKPEYPQFKVPTRRIPGPLVYAAALFDKRLSWAYLRHNLGRLDHNSHEKVERELDITLRPARESILDTCRSLVERAYVEPK